jgi:hypothetical protein
MREIGHFGVGGQPSAPLSPLPAGAKFEDGQRERLATPQGLRQ